MASYNRVILMGNLTRDIELKYTSGNTAVAQIGLALNRKYKGRDDREHEETVFVDCEAWGRTAEVMNEYLVKGDPLHLEGRLKLDQWEDKGTGKKRSKLKVVIERFHFVSGKGASSSRGAAASSGGGSGYPQQEHKPIEEDDIPF